NVFRPIDNLLISPLAIVPKVKCQVVQYQFAKCLLSTGHPILNRKCKNICDRGTDSGWYSLVIPALPRRPHEGHDQNGQTSREGTHADFGCGAPVGFRRGWRLRWLRWYHGWLQCCLCGGNGVSLF